MENGYFNPYFFNKFNWYGNLAKPDQKTDQSQKINCFSAKCPNFRDLTLSFVRWIFDLVLYHLLHQMELPVLNRVKDVQVDALSQGQEEKKINSYGVILKSEF